MSKTVKASFDPFDMSNMSNNYNCISFDPFDMSKMSKLLCIQCCVKATNTTFDPFVMSNMNNN